MLGGGLDGVWVLSRGIYFGHEMLHACSQTWEALQCSGRAVRGPPVPDWGDPAPSRS